MLQMKEASWRDVLKPMRGDIRDIGRMIFNNIFLKKITNELASLCKLLFSGIVTNDFPLSFVEYHGIKHGLKYQLVTILVAWTTI